jgi:F1F0 ATPase subunit 2
MNEFLFLPPPLVAGLLLGAVFFGGLWWTVIRAVSSQRPALWFSGSMLLRMSITLVGILFCRGRELEAVAAVSHWLCPGTPGREVADPPAARTPQHTGTGDQLCALVPMK